MQKHRILAAGLLSATLGQAAIAEQDNQQQLNACIDAAIASVDIPDSYTQHDGMNESAVKFLESETHLASISAQILPTSSPNDRTRIQLTAKFLDESNPDNYYDVSAGISFVFDNDNVHVPDQGDIFDAGVWIERFTQEGLHHYDPTPRLERDVREVWASQSATAAAFVFSHCMGMDTIMPLGYDDRSAAVPQFPAQAFE